MTLDAAQEKIGPTSKLPIFRRCPRCGHRAAWTRRCRICGAPGKRARPMLIVLLLFVVAALMIIR